jgi:hypothetical protein
LVRGWRWLGGRQIRYRRGWARPGRVLGGENIGWGGNTGGIVVTDDIPLEIAEVNARAAATSGCMTGISNVRDVVVLVIDIEIGGRCVVQR